MKLSLPDAVAVVRDQTIPALKACGWEAMPENHVEALRVLLDEAETQRSTRDSTFADVLRQRGVETPCKRCGGLGVRGYSDTSTWRGGGGGQTITSGICDGCWGSGDEHRKWLNLRTLPREVRP